MEAAGMKPIPMLVAALLVIGASAQASEVYKEKDAKGNVVYTDRPEALPAQRLNVKTQQTDTVEAKKRYDEEMKGYAQSSQSSADAAAAAAKAKAGQPTEEDLAKRCQDAKARYQSYMNAQRLYEPGPTEGSRRYLSDAELDAAREFAKKSMDAACAGQ
jgi:hypothetical protein